VLANFYPQLQALLTSKSAYNIDATAFFKRLTPHERTDPVAAAVRVREQYDVFGDGNGAHGTAAGGGGTRGSKRSRLGTGAGAGTGTGTGSGAGSRTAGAVGDGSSVCGSVGSGGVSEGSVGVGVGVGGGKPSMSRGNSTSSRANSRSNSNASLSKHNIDALQHKLGGPAPLSAAADARIMAVSHERLTDPLQAVQKSSTNSSADRAMRKNRLMNRLSTISNQF
jgi:hypothetical protein